MTEEYKLQSEDVTSMDLSADLAKKLKQILPEVFTEGEGSKPALDIEKLKIALGGAVDIEADNKIRYSFSWSGKKQAQAEANKPSSASLRPCIEESKNWENTENVYIEGDNLEVLKLLQKSYYGQVKMIYIDPPYNTGKDFVYKDNYHDNVKNYLQLTAQVDDEGNKISTNTDKNGRYHTDWLNMMYPRLKLARNLLKDDGVIFISIDDNEVHNLRKICDEIFGEDNFISQIMPIANPGGRDYNQIAITHEYLLVYTKTDITELNEISKNVTFELNDKIGGFELRELRNRNPKFHSGNRPNLFYAFYINPNITDKYGNCLISLIKNEEFYIEVKPFNSIGKESVWRWGKNKAIKNIINDSPDDSQIVARQRKDLGWNIYEKSRKSTTKIKSVWDETEMRTENGTRLMRELFNDNYFDHPKSLDLLKRIVTVGSNENDIILDFFSGSATTAHAVMQLNTEDGGKRKYICVQLPETTLPDSEAYKAGYKNICEIGKERIRRAGDKILTEWQIKQQSGDLLADDTAPTAPDIGFKVFKLDTSNVKPFDANNLFTDELMVSGRSALDLFYELVLKQGYSLDYQQTILDIKGTRCYALVNSYSKPFVLAVLDDEVKCTFAIELLKYALTVVIIKDSCFSSDEIKLNTLATLEQLQSKDNPLQIRIV